MKNSISNLMSAVIILLTFTSCDAQIKNAKTETIKIYGNCGMCEKTIEKAGNLKKVAEVDWNRDSKMATITYDSKKTSQDEILKRIALSGYDSDKFLAPDKAYNELAGCCKYEREAKTPVKTEIVAATTNPKAETPNVAVQEQNQLKDVFDNYFELKDALVKTDGTTAAAKSTNLLAAINAVNMDKLEMNVHIVWMKVLANLKNDAAQISKSKDASKQRDNFDTLSTNMYSLIKIAKIEAPIYYQFCPMANNGKGANWLSKENAIKNPYYGSQMLSCGKTVETIK